MNDIETVSVQMGCRECDLTISRASELVKHLVDVHGKSPDEARANLDRLVDGFFRRYQQMFESDATYRELVRVCIDYMGFKYEDDVQAAKALLDQCRAIARVRGHMRKTGVSPDDLAATIFGDGDKSDEPSKKVH